MAKQGFLPIYDTKRKTILGVYILPSQKVFTGNETTHNVNYPASSTSKNTVNVMKITSPFKQAQVNATFMAAVFTQDEIRLEAYKGYPNFASLSDLQYPRTDWLAPASHAMGLARTWRGSIMEGLLRSFESTAPTEP